MIRLHSAIRDKKLKVLGKANNKTADEIEKLFNLKSEEEIDAILERTNRLDSAVTKLRDKDAALLEFFYEQVEEDVNDALAKHE